MRRLKLSIFLVMLSHLVLMGLYPLMDTTEARYADIARRMLELNDWITPWFEVGQPFWGKPPLSFWVTLFGFKVFGVNEFGARFFYWIVSLLVLLVTYASAKRHGRFNGLVSVAILTSFFMFYIASISVMTDMVLLLGGVIVLYSQLNVLHGQGNRWKNSLLFALGLAIGLLAKGPIALILFVTPVFVWMAGVRNIRFFFEQYHLPLIVVVTAFIALPWYIIAEQKTPGFLNYFIVGEHWQRFLVSGWKGDLYGSAHDFPRGTIWLFMLAATLPWCAIAPYLFYRYRGTMLVNSSNTELASNYLFAGWIFTPLVFFTFAGNILWTYVLPGLPALAIFLAQRLSKSHKPAKIVWFAQISLAIVVLIKVGYLIYLAVDNNIEFKTTKRLIAEFNQQSIPLEHVYFYREVPFSAKFYSNGQVKLLQHYSTFNTMLNHNIFLVIEQDDLSNISMLNAKVTPVKTFGEFVVLQVNSNIK